MKSDGFVNGQYPRLRAAPPEYQDMLTKKSHHTRHFPAGFQALLRRR